MKAPKRRYIGDLHFQDPKVAALRGFATAEEHDHALIDAWHRSVPENGEVFVLGDISKGNIPAWTFALGVLSQLPGRKHLILGNHDPAHPLHRNGRKRQAEARDIFESISTHDTVRLRGERVYLSHFPFDGDHANTEERYVAHRLADHGHPLIHAHVHDEWRSRLSLAGTPMVCVSWEQWRQRFPTDDDIIHTLNELDLTTI